VTLVAYGYALSQEAVGGTFSVDGVTVGVQDAQAVVAEDVPEVGVSVASPSVEVGVLGGSGIIQVDDAPVTTTVPSLDVDVEVD
jgi:hypothetical protein